MPGDPYQYTADEYKNYILGFIFYKYLSEKLEKYVDENFKQEISWGNLNIDKFKKKLLKHSANAGWLKNFKIERKSPLPKLHTIECTLH